MRNKHTTFDIETCPLPLELLQSRMPQFEAAANLKDPEKIKASIEAKKQAWLDDAALSPLTGRVLAVGLLEKKQVVFCEGDEKTLLGSFWEQADAVLATGRNLVGFNCNSFDLPFLVKRSWAVGIHVPHIVGGWSGRYWNWNEDIIDLRNLWQMGDRQASGSLDSISQFLGVGRKTGNGADFAKLYETDREKALEYLGNDLRLTEQCYLRMTQP